MFFRHGFWSYWFLRVKCSMFLFQIHSQQMVCAVGCPFAMNFLTYLPPSCRVTDFTNRHSLEVWVPGRRWLICLNLLSNTVWKDVVSILSIRHVPWNQSKEMLIFLPKVFWYAPVESLRILCCAGWFFAGLLEVVLWPVRAGDVLAGFVAFVEARATHAHLGGFGKNGVFCLRKRKWDKCCSKVCFA